MTATGAGVTEGWVKPTPDEVLQILSEVCRVPLAELSPETRLIQDLDLDSVLTLELVMTLEERLGSEIQAAEAAKLVCVSDILAFVEQQDVDSGL